MPHMQGDIYAAALTQPWPTGVTSSSALNLKNSSLSRITGWLYSYVKTSASLLAFGRSEVMNYGPGNFVSETRGRTA